MTIPFTNTSPPSSSSSTLSNLSRTTPRHFRPARPFPYRLRSSTSVYLEDRQFLEGFTLLSSILLAGLSTPNAPLALVPPKAYFEVAATLIVHPQYSTRAKSEEDVRAGDEAARWLRDALRCVGPVGAGFAGAFAFRGVDRGRGEEGVVEGDMERDGEGLKSVFCAGKSVFAQRMGWWKTVGWALNCSVRHKRRWARWRVWLDIMVEILEEDWAERVLDVEERGGGEALAGELVRGAMVTRYLRGFETRNQRREIMKAILADGGEAAMSAFPEIWKDETKERKVKEEVEFAKRKGIDLEQDEWGDYDINEDEDEVMQDDQVEQDTTAGADSDVLGGIDSLRLRQRLLVLLASVSTTVPYHFTTPDSLFDMYTEFLRPLPLPTLSALLSTSLFPPSYQIALVSNTILPFLPSSLKPPNIFGITQEQLVKDFLPHAANGNGILENAKMSLLVENLLLNMSICGRLTPSPALTAAVERGIKAREEKAVGDARRRDKGRGGDEMEAKVGLGMSAERVRLMLDLMMDGRGAPHAVGNARVDLPWSSSQLSDLTQTGTPEAI